MLQYILSFSVCLSAVTGTRSQGHVTLNINVISKDLWKQGYRNGAVQVSTGEAEYGHKKIQSTAKAL